MNRCNDFLPIYHSFIALVKTQYSIVIKYFRCDLAREYTLADFFFFFALLVSDGTIHQTSCTDPL